MYSTTTKKLHDSAAPILKGSPERNSPAFYANTKLSRNSTITLNARKICVATFTTILNGFSISIWSLFQPKNDCPPSRIPFQPVDLWENSLESSLGAVSQAIRSENQLVAINEFPTGLLLGANQVWEPLGRRFSTSPQVKRGLRARKVGARLQYRSLIRIPCQGDAPK